jgi:prophage maintenance system killer protein
VVVHGGSGSLYCNMPVGSLKRIYINTIILLAVTMDPLAEAYLNCYEIVRETIKASRGRYPSNYKRFEKTKIDKYFKNVPYKCKNIITFGSDMMSTLIVNHALPNANHRTTILFMALYFESYGIHFPCYDKIQKRDAWIKDCNRYIAASKRILYSRKKDGHYREKHLKMTLEWLQEIVGDQSNSSGMMSRKSLTILKKKSSSWCVSSVIVKK